MQTLHSFLHSASNLYDLLAHILREAEIIASKDVDKLVSETATIQDTTREQSSAQAPLLPGGDV